MRLTPCCKCTSSSRHAPSVRPHTRLQPLQAVATPDTAAQHSSTGVRGTRLITAIKTPYDASGRFDLDAFDALVEQQINHGVEGLIIGGTTGEGHLMSWDEHIMLIAHTVNVFRDRILVVGNTGSNSTKEAVHATEQGFNVGMHAALQINPYYGKTSVDGLNAHFEAVMASGPGIVYNVPGRTGQDIPDDVILRLRDNPNFLGVKECTGNARIQAYAEQGVACWSGNDDEAHAARHCHGGQGVISVASNIIPGLYSRLMTTRDDALMNDLQDLVRAAMDTQCLKAFPTAIVHQVAWLFCEPNPIALNTALAMCGLIKPVFRLPYVPLNKQQREYGAGLLRRVQEHIPGCREVRVLEDDDFILLAKF